MGPYFTPDMKSLHASLHIVIQRYSSLDIMHVDNIEALGFAVYIRPKMVSCATTPNLGQQVASKQPSLRPESAHANAKIGPKL